MNLIAGLRASVVKPLTFWLHPLEISIFSYYICYPGPTGAPAGNPRRRSRFTHGRENASLGIRSRERNRTGRRTLLDPGAWLRSLLLTAVFVVFLSALACAVGLARDTTGHDWYAAGKLTWVEILLTLGFDPKAPVRYRTREGKELALTRGDLWFSGEALSARDQLFRTAKRAAWLGTWCGLGAALLCLMLVRPLEDELGERRSPREPPRRKPSSGAPTPVATAPVSAPPRPDVPQPGKPRPAGTDRENDEPAPVRRARDYERWI